MAKAPYFPPPPPIPTRTRLFQRMPPAVFVPVLGAFGLGLAWRRAVGTMGAPDAIGEVILGAVTLIYIFGLIGYMMKLIQGPHTFAEDLGVLPGRIGLTAMALSGYLLAATVVPFSPMAAGAILFASVVAHMTVAVWVIALLITGPQQARIVSPAWHLLFAGVILIPMAAVPLGVQGLAQAGFWGGLAAAIAIWGASIAQFLKLRIPAPLRPLLAVHLAPASIGAMAAFMLGEVQIAYALSVVALIILTALLSCFRWLTEAGFSPFWGAFTFPLAAFCGLLHMLSDLTGSEFLRVIAGLSLVIATLVILPILYKILQMWAKGVLAVKTNAAQA